MNKVEVTQCKVCLKVIPREEAVPGRRLCKDCRKHINSEKYQMSKDVLKEKRTKNKPKSIKTSLSDLLRETEQLKKEIEVIKTKDTEIEQLKEELKTLKTKIESP